MVQQRCSKMFKEGRDEGTRGKRGETTEGRGKERREWRRGWEEGELISEAITLPC